MKSNRPRKSANVPVTKAMLYKVRDELKSETSSIRHDLKAFRSDMSSRFHNVDSKFDGMNSKFHGIDSRFDEMNAKFHNVDSRFDDLDSKFHKVMAEIQKLTGEVHNTRLLMEEQNSKNIFVLDGYTSLSDRLSKLEKT